MAQKLLEKYFFDAFSFIRTATSYVKLYKKNFLV